MYRITVLFLTAALICPAAPIEVVVVEGQGAINNSRAHTGREPVIEVHDESGAPLTGATVTFQAPAAGASAVFSTGNGTLITQTDASGRAVARGLKPNSVKGPFQIRVTASSSGQTASTVINQTNASPAEGNSHKKAVIIGVIAAVAAGGAAAAAFGKGGSTTAAATTSTSGAIVPGTPTFGPPH